MLICMPGENACEATSSRPFVYASSASSCFAALKRELPNVFAWHQIAGHNDDDDDDDDDDDESSGGGSSNTSLQYIQPAAP